MICQIVTSGCKPIRLSCCVIWSLSSDHTTRCTATCVACRIGLEIVRLRVDDNRAADDASWHVSADGYAFNYHADFHGPGIVEDDIPHVTGMSSHWRGSMFRFHRIEMAARAHRVRRATVAYLMDVETFRAWLMSRKLASDADAVRSDLRKGHAALNLGATCWPQCGRCRRASALLRRRACCQH
jgi:hypothetical protein